MFKGSTLKVLEQELEEGIPNGAQRRKEGRETGGDRLLRRAEAGV